MRLVALFFIFLVNASATDFVLIEPGSFPRGHGHGRYGGLSRNFPLAIEPQFYGDSELPFHYAFITKPFHMGKTEVTVAEFRAFVEATNYQTDAEKSGKGIIGWSPSKYAEGETAPDWREPRHDFEQKVEFTWRNPGFPQSDDHPVVGVSWNDANAYCAWLSKRDGKQYRLPTEAEWEMVARSGQGDQFFSWGNEVRRVIQKHANIGNVELEKVRHLAAQRHWLLDVDTDPGDSHVFTAPVGSLMPNPWRLHDMSGNVFEWCQDYFKFTFYDQWEAKAGPNPVAVNPLNASEKNNEANELRVIRGGSWYTGPLAARSSARGFFDAPEAAAYIGFRVVKEASQAELAKYTDPHGEYLNALKVIEAAGGEFRPENGWASLSMRKNKELSGEVIKAISMIPDLRRVRDVKAERWDQNALDALAGMEKLYQLSIEGEGLCDLDLSMIAKQPELKILQVSANGIQDSSLTQLSGLKSLQSLYLSGICFGLTDDGMRNFAENSELLSIAVYDSTLTGEFLSSFADNPYFVELWIGGPGSDNDVKGEWTMEGSMALASSRPKLQKLALTKQAMGDDALEPLKALQRLRQLNLQYCKNITDGGVASLLESLPALRNVDLTDTNCGDLCADAISNLAGVQQLVIEGPNFSNAGIAALARSRCLKELRMRHGQKNVPVKVTAAGIAQLGRCPRLEKLELESLIVLGPEIAELSASPMLREITLPVECLTDVAVEVMTAISTLEKLNIRTRDEALYASWAAKFAAADDSISLSRR